MTGITRRVGGLMVCLTAALAPSACSPAVHPSHQAGNQPSPAMLAENAAPRPAAELLLQTEPWTLDAAAGKILHTPQYRLYTTSTKAFLLDNLPAFVETAAAHYRSSLGTLPPPRGSMEIYLLDTRPQWEQMTQRFMGDQADTYLRIQRGGFSYDGRAILYDIGRRDTFTITAHEGWHVYTQSTFKNSLPVWLEEGLATYMEGFRWDPNAADRPTFLPWANFERFDQLRWAVRSDKLMPLDLLTKSTPQELIARDSNAALHYYAQVWALVHFLNEGEQGAYRGALRAMVSDAATGQLVPRIRRELGDRAASSYSYRRRGADLIKLYTGKTAAELDPQYAAFMQQIVKTGTRTNIWQGQSPIAPVAAPAPASP
ncbi:MAG: hypothetical protein NTV94_18310 [Planctomycetota bacterium]|nr:hypothetical protein [Planctomycetota bacterium]